MITPWLPPASMARTAAWLPLMTPVRLTWTSRPWASGGMSSNRPHRLSPAAGVTARVAIQPADLQGARLTTTAFVARPHHWIEEGFATYVEPVARAQIGDLAPKTVWAGMVEGMPDGEAKEGDRGLDHTTLGAALTGVERCSVC